MTILPSDLLLPRNTVSGPGSILRLAGLTRELGSGGIVVHGRSLEKSGMLAEILQYFPADTAVHTYCHRGGEPTVYEVDALRTVIASSGAEWVAAIGGGSVLDLAKAAAGLASHTQPAAFYQLNPSAILPASIPLIAAPTTAGTGSEATVVSVLTNPDTQLKQSIRHPSHMPAIVILDPQLLAHCPPATVAAAGMDAFIQAFESYTSRYATVLTRALAECAIETISANLLPLYSDPSCTDAAARMLEASCITGMAFSHSRLGVIHGLAHPLGVRFKAAHGVVCACCLPAALEFNQAFIKSHMKQLETRCGIDVRQLVDQWMRCMHLDNPFIGQAVEDSDAFIAEVLASGSTKANPRPVTADDVLSLLKHITA